ncbi:MAG: hypothetical protein H6629_00980 [Calditrichae bacterium]|nr:hypothetical protein [Calditrichia bacterium]
MTFSEIGGVHSQELFLVKIFLKQQISAAILYHRNLLIIMDLTSVSPVI